MTGFMNCTVFTSFGKPAERFSPMKYIGSKVHVVQCVLPHNVSFWTKYVAWHFGSFCHVLEK